MQILMICTDPMYAVVSLSEQARMYYGSGTAEHTGSQSILYLCNVNNVNDKLKFIQRTGTRVSNVLRCPSIYLYKYLFSTNYIDYHTQKYKNGQ